MDQDVGFLDEQDDSQPEPGGDEQAGVKEEIESGSPSDSEEASSEEQEPDDYDPEDPAEKTPEQRRGLRKALEEERKRRREEVERNARLEGQLSVYASQKQSSGANEEVDLRERLENEVWNDPVGALERVKNELRQEYAQEQFIEAREAMAASHSDYEDQILRFRGFVDSDPTGTIMAQYNQVAPRHRPKFAYDFAKNYRQHGGSATKSDLEAEIEARIRKEYEEKARKKATADAARNASTSSASATSAGARRHSGNDVDEDDFGALMGNNY